MVSLMAASNSYAVVSPEGRGTASRGVERRPLPSLDGRRLGFVWDHMFHGDHLFDVLTDQIRQAWPTVRIVPHERFGNIHGPNETAVIGSLADRFREWRIDAAIVGVGA